MEKTRPDLNKDQTSIEDNKRRNETVTTELHFDLLKQYAWLSSAVVGVVIVVAQMHENGMTKDIYAALALLSLSILIALIGQDHIVDSLLKGKDIYKISIVLKVIRFMSMGCLGLGAGFFLAFLMAV